jgi:outer membrane biogenesis lipoprotein LolB
MLKRWAVCLVPCALSIALAGCAARRVSLPTDPGAPFPDFNQVHAQVSMACSGVRTLTAELGLSGRAGEQALRGRVVAGFARPDSMRLEGVAPFGAPAFILAARGSTATLVLPRDNHVLRGARADEILGALTGVSLAPADLQAILTGCVVAMPRPTAGRMHANGWVSIDLEGGAVIYLQRQGTMWQVRAATRSGWQIEYPMWQGMFPQSVRLRSDDAGARVDLSATIGQLETNLTLDAAQAFSVTVPEGAVELTLDELRQSGPLRGQ